MRLHVDAWDPGYGAALDAVEAPTEASAAALELDVELAPTAWVPLSPPGDVRAPDVVLLVDGVRRIDGRVWAEEDDGSVHPGLAASYAAGVVRCDLRAGRAEVVASAVQRRVFTASPGVADLVAPVASYPVRRTDSDDPAKLQAAVQAELHALEVELGTRAGAHGDRAAVGRESTSPGPVRKSSRSSAGSPGAGTVSQTGSAGGAGPGTGLAGAWAGLAEPAAGSGLGGAGAGLGGAGAGLGGAGAGLGGTGAGLGGTGAGLGGTGAGLGGTGAGLGGAGSGLGGAGAGAETGLAGFDGRLVVVDGPLHRGLPGRTRMLGYVKTHQRQYLPAELAALVGRLRPGQRSPVFRLGTSWQRHSWYLKLPGPAAPWAGVVRLEASAELTRGEVIGLADLATVALPRFASHPYKDPRAPQNLIPIGGLERRLRSMLGDPRLLLRALTVAAARA